MAKGFKVLLFETIVDILRVAALRVDNGRSDVYVGDPPFSVTVPSIFVKPLTQTMGMLKTKESYNPLHVFQIALLFPSTGNQQSDYKISAQAEEELLQILIPIPCADDDPPKYKAIGVDEHSITFDAIEEALTEPGTCGFITSLRYNCFIPQEERVV